MTKVDTFHPGQLRQTTSADTRRYDDFASVSVDTFPIPSGYGSQFHSHMPPYLPPSWGSHVDPEGAQYFTLASEPRLVTPSNAFNYLTMEKLNYWFSQVQRRLAQATFQITPHIELFLNIDDDDCEYYLVDHSTRKEFWLENLDTDALDLDGVVSPSHLDLNLESLYWKHVEQFPMHTTIPRATIDDLVCILIHGQADQTTSLVSTFPFSREECSQFLDLLDRAKEYPTDGRTTCVVARLWHSIARNRFVIHYGQEAARCSRDQRILRRQAQSRISRAVATVSSFVTFGASAHYASKLEDAYCDEIVYQEVWQKLVSTLTTDWQKSCLFSWLGLVLYALFLMSQRPSALASIAAYCFGGSIFMGGFLLYKTESLEGSTADHGLQHLSSIFSTPFQFTMPALLYSLPKSLFRWGLTMAFAAVFSHWISSIEGDEKLGQIIVLCGALLVVAIFALSKVTSFFLRNARFPPVASRDATANV